VAPRANHIRAVATITATATQTLDRFNLDFLGPRISALAVDGRRARFRRAGQELIVTPARAVPRGRVFTVEVAYAGNPRPVRDPDGSLEGWIRTEDGSAALGEPLGSPTWFPCNNVPTDKATYSFRISVPRGHAAVANGRLVSRTTDRSRTRLVWRERQPMAAYLAVLSTGHYSIRRERLAGIAAWTAIDPLAAAEVNLDPMPRILRFLSARFGTYPFDSTGAIVDLAPEVGYALETQTRPYFGNPPDEGTLVHELAHQWYGDSVTLRRWRDIWLSEGFATYAQWLWDEHLGRRSAAQRFDQLYATESSDERFWNPPPGAPGAAHLFDDTVYTRGAMTLQALRERIGGRSFFRLLRRWATLHRHGNATTADLLTLGETISDRQLDRLFRVWLYRPGKPTRW
jgi:aminopeptidase N